ncbi:MAG: FtsX-like permease family protein [Pseudomonadota bacterium]
MTWLRLSLANLTLSPVTSAVNVILMALGTASIVLVLLAATQLSETLTRDARGIDLVLGAQGSPVQLVLSSVYHADIPPGNIPLAEAERWAEDARVRVAIPLSLGDSFFGFRIVGTTPSYAEIYAAELSEGTFWQQPMQAVIGSAVATTTNLRSGAQFAGVHGLGDSGHSHEATPYTVTGVLQPTGTVLDRLILTSLDSVWDLHSHDDQTPRDEGLRSAVSAEAEREPGDAPTDQRGDNTQDHEHDHDHADDQDHSYDHAHEHSDDGANDDHDHEHHQGDDDAAPGHHNGDGNKDDQEQGDEHAHDHADHDHAKREITAMLIRYQSPLAAMTLPRDVNADGTLQAAAPAMEISRILRLVGVGVDGLRAFSAILILTAALSVFAALYSSLRARRSDLAMLRCLGATRWELLICLLLEGLLLSAMGIALGFAVGHGAIEMLGNWLEATRGVSLTGWTWIAAETYLLFGLLCVSIIAAAIPAYQAYRTDVARTLAEDR